MVCAWNVWRCILMELSMVPNSMDTHLASWGFVTANWCCQFSFNSWLIQLLEIWQAENIHESICLWIDRGCWGEIKMNESAKRSTVFAQGRHYCLSKNLHSYILGFPLNSLPKVSLYSYMLVACLFYLFCNIWYWKLDFNNKIWSNFQKKKNLSLVR